MAGCCLLDRLERTPFELDSQAENHVKQARLDYVAPEWCREASALQYDLLFS